MQADTKPLARLEARCVGSPGGSMPDCVMACLACRQ